MAKKAEKLKTVGVRLHAWKKLNQIKGDEEYDGFSTIIEEMLKERKPKKSKK